MLAQFDTLSDDSRVWVYQADRKLTQEEQVEILTAATAFLTQWAAHGQDLKASAIIMYDQLLILGADESFNAASGCSIDSSVHFVQSLGKQYEIDFFDRMQLGFLVDEGVKLVRLNEIKSAIESEEVNSESLFFQNSITSKRELESDWLVKAGESWLKRYFNVHQSV